MRRTGELMGTIRQDFEKFIKQGNLIQLAVAFVIGAAFAALVTALVTDIFTPLVGVFLKVNFSTWIYTINGSTFSQGLFINAVIAFVLIVVIIFFVIALPYQRWQDRKAATAAATSRPCPECLTTVPIAAKRCSACTSPLPPVPATPPAAAAKAS
jgi:large conductance mechanosensitive channel